MNLLDNLNDMQRQAVTHEDGSLLILAGAGSGKTKVLTTRIAYLIKYCHIDPYNILAITFTNKAAQEMKNRIENMIGKTSLIASTFHSFGVRILRENYELLGYKSNFNIMDSDDSLTLVKKILKDLGFDHKIFSPYIIRNKISSCKNEFILPDDFKKYVNNEIDDITYKVYKKYQEILYKNNALDFDDLLILPIKLFKENSDVLEHYQDRFKYILIDEYQDTNYAQYLLVKMISAKYQNICVVGDDYQSIYSFRGANYKNILTFEKDYKNCKVIKLEQNYRSTKNILNAANDVIKNNKNRTDKVLWSEKENGAKICYYRAYDEKDEVFFCIRKVKELMHKGVSLNDIAILYRTNAQSRVFEEQLLKDNIPFKIIGSFQFYQRKEIKDLLAYLRLINNCDDDISFLRAINTPKRGIGEKSIKVLQEKAYLNNSSLFSCLEKDKEKEFRNLINDLKDNLDKVSLTELIDLVLEKSGMRKELEQDHSLESDIRIENLEEFKSITKSFEEREGVVSLEDFLLEVSLVSDINEYKDDKNSLTLMTIHSVKGLEYPYVMIVGLEEGIFPHYNSIDNSEDLEEERRLMYVAITRAKEKLFITNTKKRTLFGREQVNMPSRFISEIEDSLIDIANSDLKKIIKKEDKFNDFDRVFEYGDKIIHDTYGVGVVIGINKNIISVAFNKNVGIKQLMKNHKSIKKVGED